MAARDSADERLCSIDNVQKYLQETLRPAVLRVPILALQGIHFHCNLFDATFLESLQSVMFSTGYALTHPAHAWVPSLSSTFKQCVTLRLAIAASPSEDICTIDTAGTHFPLRWLHVFNDYALEGAGTVVQSAGDEDFSAALAALPVVAFNALVTRSMRAHAIRLKVYAAPSMLCEDEIAAHATAGAVAPGKRKPYGWISYQAGKWKTYDGASTMDAKMLCKTLRETTGSGADIASSIGAAEGGLEFRGRWINMHRAYLRGISSVRFHYCEARGHNTYGVGRFALLHEDLEILRLGINWFGGNATLLAEHMRPAPRVCKPRP